MVNSADQVYILADSSKINKRGFGRICSISEVDTLITDKGISEKQYNLFIEMGIDVVIADCENLTNS
jgi:DeoR family transcriptional regulator of aga operon